MTVPMVLIAVLMRIMVTVIDYNDVS